MPYPGPDVKKQKKKMLAKHAKQLKQCCVIDSPPTNKFHWAKEVNARDNRKYLQDIKTSNYFHEKVCSR